MPQTQGIPIRRVRHAEVVLVDEVSIAYGMYWLRLRWPGPRGGIAGYMDLGTVRNVSQSSLGRWRTVSGMDGGGRSNERESVLVANRVGE